MIGKDLWQLNLVNNFAEEIRKLNTKVAIKYKDNENLKNNLIKYKCSSCSEDYSNNLDEELKTRFKNTFKFSNNDISKFVLLLRKGIYPCEYTDEWKKFNKTALLKKEEFFSNVNMENIPDADCMHAIRFWNKKFR